MAFHMLAYSKVLAANSFGTVSAVPELVIPQSGLGFIPQSNMTLLGAYAIQSNLQYAQLTSPSLRKMAPQYIVPYNSASNIGATLPSMLVLGQRPVQIMGQEELDVGAAIGPVVTDPVTALVLLGDVFEPVPTGDTYWIRFNNGPNPLTTTVGAWNILTSLQYQDPQLPAGLYAVIGFHFEGVGAYAARLSFQNQVWRPGVVAVSTPGNKSHQAFYDGTFGVYGKFRPWSMPQIEVLASAASVVSIGGFLRIVRLPDNAG